MLSFGHKFNKNKKDTTAMKEQAPSNPDYLQHYPHAEPDEARAHEIAYASKTYIESAAMMDKLATGIEEGELSITGAGGNSQLDSIRDTQAHHEQLALEQEREAGQKYDEEHVA